MLASWRHRNQSLATFVRVRPADTMADVISGQLRLFLFGSASAKRMEMERGVEKLKE